MKRETDKLVNFAPQTDPSLSRQRVMEESPGNAEQHAS